VALIAAAVWAWPNTPRTPGEGMAKELRIFHLAFCILHSGPPLSLPIVAVEPLGLLSVASNATTHVRG